MTWKSGCMKRRCAHDGALLARDTGADRGGRPRVPVDVEENVREDEGNLGKINWTLKTFQLGELTDYYKNPRSGGCVG